MLKLNLQDYNSWLSSELERLVRPAESKGMKLLEEAGRSLEEARRFFEGLARKGDRDMTSKHDPVSYRAARVLGRGSRDAADGVVQVEAPREVGWDSLKGFRDSLAGLSRLLRDIRARTAAELSGLYILDMRSFSGVTERIARAGERLSQFLEGEGSALQKARSLTSIMGGLQDLSKELSDKQVEAKDIAQEQQAQSALISELSARLDGLESGQLREVLEIEKQLRKESREFRTDTLAHLKRPLRKLRDLSLRGDVALMVDDREALEEYIQSPFKSFLSSSNGPHLRRILESLKVAIDSGKMGFKPRKTARVQSQLVQLLSSEALEAKQEKGRQLLSRRRELLEEPGCKNLYPARKELLRKLEQARREQEGLVEKARVVQEKTGSLSRRLGELLAMAETKTREYVRKEVQIEKPGSIS